MTPFWKSALFVASAVIAGAATHPSMASASFTGIHAATACRPYAGRAESAWQRRPNGIEQMTSDNNVVGPLLCAAPDDAMITSHAYLVTVSGTDPSSTHTPSAMVCAVYWDGASGASCGSVQDTPSNTGPFTLYAWDTSPWTGTGTRQYDYPVVLVFNTTAGFTLYGITVYYWVYV